MLVHHITGQITGHIKSHANQIHLEAHMSACCASQPSFEVQRQKLETYLQDVLNDTNGVQPPGRRWWRQESYKIILRDASMRPGLLQEVTQVSTICTPAQSDRNILVVFRKSQWRGQALANWWTLASRQLLVDTCR